VFIKHIAVLLSFILSIFTEGTGNGFLQLTDKHHILKKHIVHWVLLVKLINTTFQMLSIGHL